MKLAIVTALPPSKVTLNEYGYHLVKHFASCMEISELVLLTDYTAESKHIDFEVKIPKLTIRNCWRFNSYKNVLTIYKAIFEEKPDVILFNLQFLKFGDKKIAATLPLVLPLLCKLKQRHSVVLLHNILEEVDLSANGFATNKVMHILYNAIGTGITKLLLQANLLAVTIEKYKTVLEKKYQCKNVVLVPHGAFETPEIQFGISKKNTFRVLAFGKFGTYKKVEILIDAVIQLRKHLKTNIEVVIAGTDNPNCKGYLESVQNKYAHVPNLIFTGYVEENNVADIFLSADVVVFPYTGTTGSSGVLHQAGSYGKAVVLPNIGDLSLLIEEEGYCGEFFDPHSTESLANAIENILTNETYRLQIEKANYKASCTLSMENVAKMYIGYFKLLIENKIDIAY